MKAFSGFLILISWLVLSCMGLAQDNEKTLLWEIKGKRVKSPSYLFGTMHLIPKHQFYFPESIQQKVLNSDQLVMEIGGLSEQLSAAKYMMLKEGSVFDLFSPVQLDSLFHYIQEELGMDEPTVRKRYSRIKPLALLQLITQNTFGESPESYELRLELLANQNGIKVAGLETVEEQVAIFDQMTLEDQVAMVMTGISNTEESTNESRKLIELYLSQDIDAMARLLSEGGFGDAAFEAHILTNRNQKWIPLIQKLIRKDACFIAVGAAHLGGPEGVVQLLRNAGYSVEPVKF
jgi:uncharacterized protein